MAFEIQHTGTRKKFVRPAMNVTPLVDVVLVLLIIFMVVTPLLTRHFWTNVPQKEDKAQPPPPPSQEEPPPQIVLSVRKDGSIRINKDTVPLAALPDRLRRIFGARRDNTLFFDAEGDVEYGRAIETLDAARAGGALTIAVLTESPKSE